MGRLREAARSTGAFNGRARRLTTQRALGPPSPRGFASRSVLRIASMKWTNERNVIIAMRM